MAWSYIVCLFYNSISVGFLPLEDFINSCVNPSFTKREPNGTYIHKKDNQS